MATEQQETLVQFKVEDINRVIFHLNNLTIRGVEQASAIVDIVNILNSGKIINANTINSDIE